MTNAEQLDKLNKILKTNTSMLKKGLNDGNLATAGYYTYAIEDISKRMQEVIKNMLPTPTE